MSRTSTIVSLTVVFCLGTAVGILVAPPRVASAQAPAAAPPRPLTDYERDCKELDRSRDTLVQDIDQALVAAKVAASEVTLQNLNAPDKPLEAQIKGAWEQAMVSVQLLWLQTFVLAVDHAVEEQGADAQAELIRMGAEKLGVRVEDVQALRGQGHTLGSIVLGYVLARAAEKGADQVWQRKSQGLSWPAVAHELGIKGDVLEKAGALLK